MRSHDTEVNKNRFLIGIALNTTFVIVEVYYGFKADSVALLADAAHKASDVVGLGLAWLSYYLADKQATAKFTYGFKNATIFAAFLNSLILIIAIANLLLESVNRLFTPEPVAPIIVICVAAFGVLINTAAAMLFIKDKNTDLNILGVFLNMALDAILSIAVVIGGILIWWQGWFFIDPVLGIIIGVTIIFSIWQLFKESLHLILQAVPNNIDLQAIIADLKQVPGVIDYHDLHVWALSTTETALSVHILTNAADFSPSLNTKLTDLLSSKYDIHHATIQLEVSSPEKSCLSC